MSIYHTNYALFITYADLNPETLRVAKCSWWYIFCVAASTTRGSLLRDSSNRDHMPMITLCCLDHTGKPSTWQQQSYVLRSARAPWLHFAFAFSRANVRTD